MKRKHERSEANRLRRKLRVRKRVTGTTERPRLTVYRSDKHIYAQVIDDSTGATLAAFSTVAKGFEKPADGDKKASARLVGETLAARCIEAGVRQVVFDRNGYLYNSGRVRALADGARAGGLDF